jgi:GNAT superfamily N-acetyltransferase
LKTTIRLTDVAEPEVRDVLVDGLVVHSTEQTGIEDRRPLVLALEDAEGRVVGGLWGRTVFGWLVVELLFVPEPLRRTGVGAELMARAESEAVARGCHAACLDTFEFQARGFYERLGYRCFGELGDFPAGRSRYFMRKTLASGSE